MIKLHAHIPEKADGTSWYRGAGPLRALEKTHRDVIDLKIFDANQNVDWHDLADADVVFLQRPFSDKCAEFFGIGVLFGAKVICDWDDCFGTIHRSNPTYQLYQSPRVKATVKGLMEQTHAAWTTTEHLQQYINAEAGANKATVVPNAWPDLWFSKFSSSGENNMVYWRGGGSHLGDLLDFAPAIGRVAGKFPLWKFMFAGDMAWPIHDQIPADRLENMAWLPAPLYTKSILQQQPAIVAVPLQDTAFNRSKSNIAWMEGVASGAVIVCPDWPEWGRPGTFRYTSKDDFAEKLKEAMSTPRKKRAEMAAEGQQYIIENLRLSKVNERRMDTIKELLTTPVDKLINESK